MSSTSPSTTSLRVSDLSQSGPTAFNLRPDKAQLQAIAQELGLDGLRKLSFEGDVRPQGKSDWVLQARLGATVIQPCVVTLEPVTTRIEAPVARTFLRDYTETDEPEAEMPEDDTREPLGTSIDPAAIMLEALALNLPEYPRKDGAGIDSVAVTEPGKKPMTDEDARPFAGLADLKARLEDDKDS
ncbi:DUF177 domain-containing protein [Sulfitobacter sp. S190]|uniref:YceD family protein n=1 Tax=Sulfitobacter sp. S190 TaxID=2867022 RepID=UPI0021A37213|nr:DUF177 domain-containing protein [Sulfitobacter sp. S190]UWR23810.1 DUF177 domain-containing protein [Sulfitobacter sp. S190]